MLHFILMPGRCFDKFRFIGAPEINGPGVAVPFSSMQANVFPIVDYQLNSAYAYASYSLQWGYETIASSVGISLTNCIYLILILEAVYCLLNVSSICSFMFVDNKIRLDKQYQHKFMI